MPVSKRNSVALTSRAYSFIFSAIAGQPITGASSGILFLDEAQATPSAYACLRYFYEDVPNLAIVLTGSLLDQVLENYPRSSPVGRVEHQYMGPVSFDEFLAVTGQTRFVDLLSSVTLATLADISDELHQEMLQQVRRYILCHQQKSSAGCANSLR